MECLILGGTGTLGQAMLRRLLKAGLRRTDITIYSRDELKQQQLKAAHPGIKCMLGDIRDKNRLKQAAFGKDIVFHFAALKHIDVLEENAEESVKTNIIGTINAAQAAVCCAVKYFVFSSTDKAVLPINTYGYCKGIGERYLTSMNRLPGETKFSVYRWGNVVGSRGSAIPKFAKQLLAGETVTITHPAMTRFWIDIDEAAKYVYDTYHVGGDILVPAMKAAKVVTVINTIANMLGVKQFAMKEIGIRAGEKIHECLYTSHDSCVRSDTTDHYTQEELEALLAPALEKYL